MESYKLLKRKSTPHLWRKETYLMDIYLLRLFLILELFFLNTRSTFVYLFCAFTLATLIKLSRYSKTR